MDLEGRNLSVAECDHSVACMNPVRYLFQNNYLNDVFFTENEQSTQIVSFICLGLKAIEIILEAK